MIANDEFKRNKLARAVAVEQAAPDGRDAAAVELIDELESLKNTVAAAQARLPVALKGTRVEERAHLPAPLRERGIGAEVALARRESPHRGGIHLGLGRGVLVSSILGDDTLTSIEYLDFADGRVAVSSLATGQTDNRGGGADNTLMP